jgi:hypothetical protein
MDGDYEPKPAHGINCSKFRYPPANTPAGRGLLRVGAHCCAFGLRRDRQNGRDGLYIAPSPCLRRRLAVGWSAEAPPRKAVSVYAWERQPAASILRQWNETQSRCRENSESQTYMLERPMVSCLIDPVSESCAPICNPVGDSTDHQGINWRAQILATVLNVSKGKLEIPST